MHLHWSFMSAQKFKSIGLKVAFKNFSHSEANNSVVNCSFGIIFHISQVIIVRGKYDYIIAKGYENGSHNYFWLFLQLRSKRCFHSLFKEYRVQPKEFSYTNLTSVAHTNNLSVILLTKSLNNLILIRFCKTMEITTPQKLIFSGSPP